MDDIKLHFKKCFIKVLRVHTLRTNLVKALKLYDRMKTRFDIMIYEYDTSSFENGD